jgi:hypothetical protein
MNLDLGALCILIERLRKSAIGEPRKIAEKDAFEYPNHSAMVVAVLKLVRAAHGLNALSVLCRSGLFIDFGAIIRCVNDAVDEVYFLLEKYPNTSSNVDRFVTAFFENTIDGYLSVKTSPVPSDKIRAARVRLLKGRHDERLRQLLDSIYTTFCGYVHANYAHIMEVYNGKSRNFNLAGVPSRQQIAMRMEPVEVARTSVVFAAAFVARTLGMSELCEEILRLDEG